MLGTFMSHARGCIAPSAVSLLLACGSTSTVDAPAPAPPAPNDETPPPPDIATSGTIKVTELTMYEMGMLMPSISAAFSTGGTSDSAPIASEGPCAVYHATNGAGGSPRDIGAITVEGGTKEFQLRYDNGGYAAERASGPLFEDGALLRAAGAGKDGVEPFVVEATAPKKLVPSSPDFRAGLSLSAREALTVTWPAAEKGGSMFIEVLAQGRDPVAEKDAAVTVSCSGPDVGSLTMPSSLLAHLPRVAGNGMLMMTRFSTASTTVGDVQIELKIESTACTMGSIRD